MDSEYILDLFLSSPKCEFVAIYSLYLSLWDKSRISINLGCKNLEQWRAQLPKLGLVPFIDLKNL